MSDKLWYLLRSLRNVLTEAQAGTGKPAPQAKLRAALIGNYVPNYWREEAKSQEEWFIRYMRSSGLHTTLDAGEGKMIVRLVKDAADESTITWPGKDVAMSGNAKPWSDARGGQHAEHQASSAAEAAPKEEGPGQRVDGGDRSD